MEGAKPVPFFEGFPFHFRSSPARLINRHTLAGPTATMSASSIMNVSRRAAWRDDAQLLLANPIHASTAALLSATEALGRMAGA
jgi:hypothetical protein